MSWSEDPRLHEPDWTMELQVAPREGETIEDVIRHNRELAERHEKADKPVAATNSRHPYQRDLQSGAGNCVCGAAECHKRHPHQFMLPAFVDTTNCCCTEPYRSDCHVHPS